MFTAYAVALFIHILGVVTLFISFGLMQRTATRIRLAPTIDEMKLWLGFMQTTRRMFPAALVLILASGLYMTEQAWSFDTPWIVVAIATVLLIGIVGALVVGRGFAAIGRAVSSAGAVTPDIAETVARPTPWLPAAALNGMAIGVLWLMVNKPGWTQSILVVFFSGIVGTVVGTVALRRDARNP